MRRSLAVHLAIRPRLRLPPEPPAARRKRWRLPPLALPAAGYWVAMAGLTYFFAHLGPHPLESLLAAPQAAAVEDAPAPVRAAPRVSEPATSTEAAPFAAAALAPAEIDAPTFVPTPPPAVLPPTVSPTEPADDSSPAPARRRPEASAPSPTPAPEAAPDARVALSFPEFTDSSRPARRERAADGPRIDSLFEPGDASERPTSPSAEPSPPERELAEATSVTSCEAAIARNNDELSIGGPRGPADVTREAYAGILQNGRYLAGCSIPDRTVFEICAAVKQGRAVGVTVVSTPGSSELNACVKRAVSRLRFPQSPKLDVTHTRFDAVRR